jgi:hypothetical protein
MLQAVCSVHQIINRPQTTRSVPQIINGRSLNCSHMYDITIVCTHHSEIGNCNSDELYKILESIQPDVIFEELPQDLFDKFYPANQLPYEPPEVKSVRRYLSTHCIDHIPVDIDVSQSLSTRGIYYVFDRFKSYYVYKKLENEQRDLMVTEGYAFLNSKRCEELFTQKAITEQTLLASMMNSQLSRIYQLFCEEQENREHEIIKNIYNYSKQKPYSQGILLIGSGHRKTILEKIETYKTQEDLKLNWVLYNA